LDPADDSSISCTVNYGGALATDEILMRFNQHLFWLPLTLVATATLTAAPLNERSLHNETAYIPAQCYTKTEDSHGHIHNPCYACHTVSEAPNYVNDAALQRTYALPLAAEHNPWTNLFRDRRTDIAAISDEDIITYIRHSNYHDDAGQNLLAQRLAEVPADWDYDGDGQWGGFIPDCYFNFDAEGFDQAPDGTFTGWRAFAYYPFLGTFWPTNGATDDVLIRLPEVFRHTSAGEFDLDVYKTNLAIVEAMIRERDIAIEPVDEAVLGGVDLDGNGIIAVADSIHYDWAPREGRQMWFVGQALQAQRDNRIHLAARLYPEGTEFLHTVRYIDVDATGANQLAARMKEVRYGRKVFWMSYADLEQQAAAEVKEQHDFPDRTRIIRGNLEAGVSNDQGWRYSAFIEDADGHLRPQSYEELVFCVGCHSGLGATTDSSFAFPRRFGSEHFQHGWYHWSQKGLRGTPEPLRQDGQPEYAFYLDTNGAGDEFRANQALYTRFFDAQGHLFPEARQALRHDIAELLFASPARALQLNKAYRVIVQEQSFKQGRDATIMPLHNVHDHIASGTPTGIIEPVVGF
jgi:hypothetical protein